MCAWTAFRLLATQCINWSLREESQTSYLIDKSTISKLQDQIFDLMCEELKRIAEQMKSKTTTTSSSKTSTPVSTNVIKSGNFILLFYFGLFQ
jgi:isocitrate dehydrogenase